MADNGKGMPRQVVSTLIRPTPPEPETETETVGSGGDGTPAGPVEGQGGATGNGRPPVPRGRPRRVPRPKEKTSKRGLYLTADVWKRLQLDAIDRHATVSAVAQDVLDKGLPRLTITRD
jgi:hypothetical protein